MTVVLDLAFPVAGDIIDRDYQTALYRALAQRLPWLEDELLAGVHPIRGLTPCPGGLLIGGRTLLVLRVPERRAEACAALEGAELEFPAPLRLGRASRRELMPYPALHTRLAITGAQDEIAFVDEVRNELAALGIDCEMIVGRRGELRLDTEATLAGYSLMLHKLSPANALLAQHRGVGRERKLGCGLFVPHKSVAAVGSRDWS